MKNKITFWKVFHMGYDSKVFFLLNRSLKGQCYEIFLRKFAEIFASRGAPPMANLPPVSMTPVVHLEVRILANFRKIRNGLNGN
jgi:hypothetical protein